MNMIEKVARALVNSADVTHVNWKEKDWPEFVEQARVAIEAMREPTEEIKNVETGSIHYTQVELWNEFINAALKED